MLTATAILAIANNQLQLPPVQILPDPATATCDGAPHTHTPTHTHTDRQITAAGQQVEEVIRNERVCVNVCIFDPLSYMCGCRSPQMYEARVSEMYDKLWVCESDGSVREARRGEASRVE